MQRARIRVEMGGDQEDSLLSFSTSAPDTDKQQSRLEPLMTPTGSTINEESSINEELA